jgi:hypothetical protein
MNKIRSQLAYVSKNFQINIICSIFVIHLNSVSPLCSIRRDEQKQDSTCICFKEILNQFSLLYTFICLYLKQIKSYGHAS